MQVASRQDWYHFIVVSLVILVCVLAIIWVQLPQLQQLQAQSETASVEEIRKEVDAEGVRLKLLQNAPALGFDNLVADWTFLNFLQYFGDEAARAKSDYHLSPDYFEVILGRNPYFLQAYTFLSTSTSMYAGLPERSIAIAQKALQSLKPTAPEGSYYAWRQVAIDQLLFLGDAEGARRSFETAAQWATLQGNANAASLSQQTADFLATNPDSKFAQLAAWTMVLASAPDDRSRQTAVSRIEALGGKIIENPDGSFSIEPPAQD